jgi:hypothetical protein
LFANIGEREERRKGGRKKGEKGEFEYIKTAKPVEIWLFTHHVNPCHVLAVYVSR